MYKNPSVPVLSMMWVICNWEENITLSLFQAMPLFTQPIKSGRKAT